MAARMAMIRTLLSVAPLLLCWVAAPCAGADDTTGAIAWPLPGRPAVAVAGAALDVGLRQTGALQLASNAVTVALTLPEAAPLGGITRSAAQVPATVPPGVYDLIFTSGDVEERQQGVVYIVPTMPPVYAVALVRASAIAGDSDFGALREQLTASGVSLAFLMGPLVPEAQPGAYAVLREQLAGMPVPLFLCPAERDQAAPEYRANFGFPVYGVAYGEDGFLMLGAGFPAADAAAHSSLGTAYLVRRELRGSRWSIGITSRFGLDWNPRSQIALFVDDPLDYLIAGASPPELGAEVPWGHARLMPPPKVPVGDFLVLDVDAGGIRVRQAEIPAE